jgi:hypothetical protein
MTPETSPEPGPGPSPSMVGGGGGVRQAHAQAPGWGMGWLFISEGANVGRDRTLDHSLTGTTQGRSAAFCYWSHTKLENSFSPVDLTCLPYLIPHLQLENWLSP